jgi:hypothetical protein
MDQCFLMWVMDLQERVNDSQTDELLPLKAEVEAEGNQIYEELKRVFNSNSPNLTEAITLTKKLNFIHRLEQTILDRLPVK